MTEELCHIRCIQCGKVLAHKWGTYKSYLAQGIRPGKALDMVGMERYCCRMNMMNPFKIPIASRSKIDPRTEGLENLMDELTVSEPEMMESPQNPLIDMSGSSYTVIPETTEIELPTIPEVSISDFGAILEKEKQGFIKTIYKAE